MSKVIYVTQEWLDKLNAELAYLKNEKRVEIAEKLKEAISFWDLSENSEYEDARNEQAQVEKRIFDLEDQLNNVELVKESTWKENKVSIWSEVELENSNWEKTLYKIVGTTEADILAEVPRISNESLVWKAILGKKKWDSVKVKAHSWTFEYKITKIK